MNTTQRLKPLNEAFLLDYAKEKVRNQNLTTEPQMITMNKADIQNLIHHAV